MFKVTIKFVFYFLVTALAACGGEAGAPAEKDTLQAADAASEARIDAAYEAITRECDSLLTFAVPAMADSLWKNDSLDIRSFFDTAAFHDANAKVEKVVRQLKADCYSNLLKETYKRYRQLKLSKPKRHKKAKA